VFSVQTAGIECCALFTESISQWSACRGVLRPHVTASHDVIFASTPVQLFISRRVQQKCLRFAGRTQAVHLGETASWSSVGKFRSVEFISPGHLFHPNRRKLIRCVCFAKSWCFVARIVATARLRALSQAKGVGSKPGS